MELWKTTSEVREIGAFYREDRSPTLLAISMHLLQCSARYNSPEFPARQPKVQLLACAMQGSGPRGVLGLRMLCALGLRRGKDDVTACGTETTTDSAKDA